MIFFAFFSLLTYVRLNTLHKLALKEIILEGLEIFCFCIFGSNSCSFIYPLLLLQVDNIENSFSIIKSKPKPLAAYLFTNDEQLKKDYVQNISSGGMLINDTIIHVTILYLILIRSILTCQHNSFLSS